MQRSKIRCKNIQGRGIMDNWQKDLIYRMYKQGKPQRDIANAVGVTVVTVNKTIKKIKEAEKPKTIKGEIVPQHNGMVTIDLSQVPNKESVMTDIMIVYRQSLAELQARMPEMSTNEVYTLSMTLLRELNGGNVES